ncbi:MAG: Multi-sensor signal transduction histidine kinase [Pedosphaera sp.]|nr:Multi-sensor signal transduction histidine kinase [Pedosphaera sp.]
MKEPAPVDIGSHRDAPALQAGARSQGVTRFDDLTSLAACAFQAPFALLTLINQPQPRVVSSFGLGAKAIESFTPPTLLPGELLLVADTLQDERFRDHPLVMGEPHVRFYAGVTLSRPDGKPAGVLCVMDRVPRLVSAQAQQALSSLARLAEAELPGTPATPWHEGIDLLEAVAPAVNETRELESALSITLRKLLDASGWILAQAWIPRADGTVLECSPAWHATRPDLGTFRAANEGLTFAPGIGLPGQAWAARKAVWTQSMEPQPGCARAAICRAAGLQSGMAFPVLAGQEVLAVMEFFKFEPKPEDGRLFKLVSATASQLGSILHQKRAEESLLRERNLSESLINSLPGIFYLFNQQGRFLRWNRNLELVSGYSAGEFATLGPLDFFSPEARNLMAARIETVFAQGQAEVEATFLSKTGVRTPFYLTGSAMMFDGKPCVVGMGMDITKRKREEESHAALSKLGQSLSCCSTAQEAAEIIRDIADELFGWDACAINMYFGDMVYPILNMDIIDGQRSHVEERDLPSAPSARALRVMKHGAELFLIDNPVGFSPEAKAFGNRSCPSASIMMAPIRNRTSAVGILTFQSYTPRAYDEQDLGILQTLADHCGGALERIRAEQELKSSETRFHSIWESSVDGMRLTDERGMIVAVNEAFCRLVGLPAADLVNHPFTVTYSTAENLEQILLTYQQRFQSRSVEKMIERKLTFRSGKTVELEVTNSFIHLPDEQGLLLGLFRDTTEHKRAEEELRKSEAQLRLLWENSLDGMRLLDEHGTFMIVNEAYCRLVEKPREALLGQLLSVVYDTVEGERILTQHRDRFRSRLVPPHLEREVTLWNGKRIFVELSNSMLEVEGQPTMLLSAVRDITVSKRVQRRIQLLEQQRALEKERDRIARDMHDDVGGSLTRITLLSEIAEAEIASGKITVSEDAKSRIQKISAMSREVVRNIDEIVWAVDPGNDSLEKFGSYICHMAEELLKVTPINCRLDVPTLFPHYFLGSDVRHNLFLVVKESLNNMVKHAQASEVSLQMGIAGTHFTIRLQDNGRGFEAAESKPFANGLNNMRMRMEKIGGSLKLETRPGHGTTTTLGINLER